MSEEKLDLALTTISKLKSKAVKLDSKGIGRKKNKLVGIKKQIKESLAANQRNSIELETKEDIKREVSTLLEEINHLEINILIKQAKNLQESVKVRQLKARVLKIKEKLQLAA